MGCVFPGGTLGIFLILTQGREGAEGLGSEGLRRAWKKKSSGKQRKEDGLTRAGREKKKAAAFALAAAQFDGQGWWFMRELNGARTRMMIWLRKGQFAET